MMNTPICDFVARYADEQKMRLHMPGHKGRDDFFKGRSPASLDITEIDGADVLYHADGIIRQSEQNASKLFDSAKTLYSTEGSSLSIRAMLYLTLLYGRTLGRRPVIAACRNAHQTLMTAAALLDMSVQFVYPRQPTSLLSCAVSASDFECALQDMTEKPLALYVTSPDYLGHMADIEELAAACHRHEMLLLVDNAHGAYLQFLSPSRHPLALGADVVSDSAHKTLPVLTGGGYLHIGKGAPASFLSQAEKAMSMFASTSPSYLILSSLDSANRYLAEGYAERLSAFGMRVALMKKHLEEYGYTLVGEEILKLTLVPKAFGYTGAELAHILLEKGIVTEFYDRDFTVMMLTPEITKEELDRLEETLLSIQRRSPIQEAPPPPTAPRRAISIREALFSDVEELPTAMCRGRILATAALTCPPAIPIAVCGEVIDDAVIKALLYYGNDKCLVVKN